MALTSRSLMRGQRLVTQPPAAVNVTRVKSIMSVPDKELDLLLREVDLPPYHKDFFKFIPINEFYERFPLNVKRIYYPKTEYNGENREAKLDEFKRVRRLSVVLPLLAGTQVIPISFILDTGAPECMYLCAKAVHLLDNRGVIRHTVGRYPYQLLGQLLGPGDKKLDHPGFEALPASYESHLPDDPRRNLLGLQTILHFCLLTPREQPKE